MFEKADVEISRSEVLGAIRKMKSGKASGVDGVKAEYLKNGGEVCADWMVRMLNVCLNTGSVPNEWKIGCIIPLYKGKGDSLACRNKRSGPIGSKTNSVTDSFPVFKSNSDKFEDIQVPAIIKARKIGSSESYRTL